MEIKTLPQSFSVCQVENYSLVDPDSDYCFLGKTDEERSLVCPTGEVPSNTIRREDGWRAFRIQGVLDFSLVGILSEIAAVLANTGLSIFAISTYNTDYVLVKEKHYTQALDVLASSGYTIVD